MSSSENRLELKLLDNLRRSRDRISEERERRQTQLDIPLSFGVKFLDQCLGGICPNDLILLGAKTGIGKTQLASIAAMTNAAAGKRVCFFALEAEPNEIESRITYQMLADVYYKLLRKDFPNIHLNYMDWYNGCFKDSLGKVEEEIEALQKDMYPDLWTYYRSGDFTIQEFEQKFMAMKDQTDLFVIDHLHYFDFEDENENRAMKATVKKIRDLAILFGKPIILVAHLRKSDKRTRQIAPDLDDFHGSSDITKIATKVITLAPGPQGKSIGNKWPTYMRVGKCRVDGSRTKLIGLNIFNADVNKYHDYYYLGRLYPAEDKFEPITNLNEIPHWAKSAQIYEESIGWFK